MTSPMMFILAESLPVRPYQPRSIQCQNCWCLDFSAECPLCAQPSHDQSNCSLQSCTCASCSSSHDLFHRGCPTCRVRWQFLDSDSHYVSLHGKHKDNFFHMLPTTTSLNPDKIQTLQSQLHWYLPFLLI